MAPLPAAGWYRDPDGSGGERYWDGARWTAERRGGAAFSAPGSLAAQPVTRSSALPAAGWYPDPDGSRGMIRYWNGNRWTTHRKEITAPAGHPAETLTVDVDGPVLVAADGAAYPLDRAYVIGRAPLADVAVRGARASPLMVHDDDVSRVHAYLSIHQGGVFVRDASTQAGTFIAAPGAKTWTRVGATPTELRPGWSLRVGARILTYKKGSGP